MGKKLKKGISDGSKYVGAALAVTTFSTLGACSGMETYDALDTVTKPMRRKLGGTVTVKEKKGWFTKKREKYRWTNEYVDEVEKENKKKKRR
jgi:hypothetical protein